MKKEKKNSQTKDYQVSRLKVELLYQIKNMIVLFKLSCTTESKTQVNDLIIMVGKKTFIILLLYYYYDYDYNYYYYHFIIIKTVLPSTATDLNINK